MQTIMQCCFQRYLWFWNCFCWNSNCKL